MTVLTLQKFAAAGILLLLVALAGCNPLKSMGEEKVGQSQYLVDSARLYGTENDLGMTDILTYPKHVRKGPPDISTNGPNKKLTMNRCVWCHECGFTDAFDYANRDKEGWNPVYRGEAWRPIVLRMNDNDETMLNEQIAERIYSYLHDETLGIYVEEEDTGPEIRIEVDDIADIQVIQGDIVEDEAEADPPADASSGESTPPPASSEAQ